MPKLRRACARPRHIARQSSCVWARHVAAARPAHTMGMPTQLREGGYTPRTGGRTPICERRRTDSRPHLVGAHCTSVCCCGTADAPCCLACPPHVCPVQPHPCGASLRAHLPFPLVSPVSPITWRKGRTPSRPSLLGCSWPMTTGWHVLPTPMIVSSCDYAFAPAIAIIMAMAPRHGLFVVRPNTSPCMCVRFRLCVCVCRRAACEHACRRALLQWVKQ